MRGLIAAVLSLVAVTSWAQTAPSPVTRTVFVPPVYYVGDPVEVRLTLLLPEGRTVLPPLALPEQSWVLIRDVQVRPDPPFEYVTIKFVPFAPGPKVLPPLVLGDVTLNDVQISTSSLLSNETPSDLAPPRDQLTLPHTELALFGVFVVIVVVPIVVVRTSRPVVSSWRRWSNRRHQRRASRQFDRDVRHLRSRVHALMGPDFYTEFSQAVRKFLSVRFSEDFQTLTPTEAHRLLAGLPPAWSSEWVRLLQKADIVRFDAKDPPASERLDDLDSVQRELEHLDTQETSHAHL